MLFVVPAVKATIYFSLGRTYMFSPDLTVAICSRCPVCPTRIDIKLWQGPLSGNDVDRQFSDIAKNQSSGWFPFRIAWKGTFAAT